MGVPPPAHPAQGLLWPANGSRSRTLATTEFHIATSRRLLEQAEREYRAGDVLQASEKGWGAAAHAVKAIAGHTSLPP